MKLIRCQVDICDCLSKLQVMLNKLCMCLRFPKIPVILPYVLIWIRYFTQWFYLV